MGTHPIFESDFDCLTEQEKKEKLKLKNGELGAAAANGGAPGPGAVQQELLDGVDGRDVAG